MKHIVTHKGLVGVSLGLMQEACVHAFMPWINWRVGIEGTLQRPPFSLAMGLEWVRGLDKQKGSNEVFAVLAHPLEVGRNGHKSFRYVGHMSIHGVSWPNGTAKTGSILGDGRGGGVGTEAKLLLLHHAFKVLGVRKLTSSVKAFNGPSLGHLMKCGYKPVGRYKAHDFHEGAYVDEILFEVFRENWEPIWDKYQKTKTLPKLSDRDRKWVSQTASS